MKNYFSVFASSPFFFLGVFLIFVSSCDKEDNKNDVPGIPELATSAVTDITDLTATSGGIITSDGGATVTVRGVCWSIRQNPTINDKKTEDGLVVECHGI